jgi:HSP20 family protein
MTGFRWSSLQDLFAIQEKMNRLFEETIHRTEFPDEGLDAALWSPAADVYETPEEVVLSVELPGVRLEDVHLEAIDGGKLRVSGVRRGDEGVEPRQFVRMERIYGNFSRDFAVPPTIDSTRIKATLKSGILRVVAPKKERAQPIAVESKKAK